MKIDREHQFIKQKSSLVKSIQSCSSIVFLTSLECSNIISRFSSQISPVRFLNIIVELVFHINWVKTKVIHFVFSNEKYLVYQLGRTCTLFKFIKAFPYAFFCVAFMLTLPSFWWILAESEYVKRQEKYKIQSWLKFVISVRE